jgi:hypothetical protein
MLARIEAATARVEGKLDEVLTGIAALPRPVGHPLPGRPVAKHALRDRLSCRGHQPRLRGARPCARDRHPRSLSVKPLRKIVGGFPGAPRLWPRRRGCGF